MERNSLRWKKCPSQNWEEKIKRSSAAISSPPHTNNFLETTYKYPTRVEDTDVLILLDSLWSFKGNNLWQDCIRCPTQISIGPDSSTNWWTPCTSWEGIKLSLFSNIVLPQQAPRVPFGFISADNCANSESPGTPRCSVHFSACPHLRDWARD